MQTFNKRMGQIAVKGETPPYMEYESLHTPFLLALYGILAYLVFLDWRWALTLYVFTFALAVSPILETLGKMLLFLWLKRRID